MKNLIKKENLIFASLLLVGAILRLYNINWDNGNYFYADERYIAYAVTNLHLPHDFDPDFYSYNGLFIYLVKFIAMCVNYFTQTEVWDKDWGNVSIIARYISVISSIISIGIFTRICKLTLQNIFYKFASVIFALSVGLIQYAHYGAVESLLTLILLLIVWWGLPLTPSQRVGTLRKQHDLSLLLVPYKGSLVGRRGLGGGLYWVFMGILCGIALGIKTTAVTFLIIPFVIWLNIFVKSFKSQPISIIKNISLGLIFISTVILIAFLTSPYAFIKFQEFKDAITFESEVLRGVKNVPYTLQFRHTMPILYQLKNLNVQTVILLPYIGLSGLVIFIYNTLRSRKFHPALPFVIFSLIYFVYIGSLYTKFIRYMIPFIPALIWGAGYLFQKCRIRNAEFGMKNREISKGINLIIDVLMIFFVVAAITWCFAYIRVFSGDVTKIQATDWINKNVPLHSVIINELWDDHVPADPINFNIGKYVVKDLDLFAQDDDSKAIRIADSLSSAEYMVIASSRVYGTIYRIPDEFPLTKQYYDKLFAGDLGYTVVAEFEEYPGLGNFNINDKWAEETFYVMDHPKVIVFQNTGMLEGQEIYDEIMNEG